MESKQQKQLLREEMSIKLSKFPRDRKDDIDQKTCADLYQIIKITNAKTVHAYLPIKAEIDISPLLKKLLRENFTVVCPKTLADGMLQHYELEDLEKTKQGLYNTSYPDNNKEWKNGFDLIIVPGLAFDQEGNRIGYGGGYYDRFLKEHIDSFSIGICYPFQLIHEVPTEDYDIRVDDVYFSAL